MHEEADRTKLRESTPQLKIGSEDAVMPDTSASESAPAVVVPHAISEEPDDSHPVDPTMDDPPGLDSAGFAWLPIGKRYQLDLPIPVSQFTQILESLCFQKGRDRIDSDKPLGGYVDQNSFELFRRSDFFRMWFQPAIEGRYEQYSGMTRVRILTKLRPGTQKLLGAAPAAFIGASLAAVLSSYMLPHVVALFYSFVGTVTLPLVLSIVCFFIAKWVVPTDLRYLMKLLRSSVNRSMGSSKKSSKGSPKDTPYEDSSRTSNYEQVFTAWTDLKLRGFLSDEVKAGIIAVVVYIAAAVGTHAIAWNYWTEGKYDVSASLCLPGVQLTQVVLGSDSGPVADARYYLAECYRCMGKLDDAEKLYGQALKTWSSTIGNDHMFLADAEFNIGRVYELQGKSDLASAHYLNAAKIWQRALGNNSMAESRTYDRIASNLLKQGKIDDAVSYMKRALDIDRTYGSSAGRSVGEDLNDLAVLMMRKGDMGEAQKLLDESLKFKTKQVGKNGYSLVSTLLNLSVVHRSFGREHLAQKDLLRAREILNRHLKRLKLQPSDDLYMDLLAVLRKHQNDYEAPVFDTRSDNTSNPIVGRL